MRKVFPILVVWLVLLSQVQALEPAADPSLAVVRIKSHGASGTIVSTTDGKSWILSCAHMFYGKTDQIDPAMTAKKIVIDGPAQPYAPRKLAEVRILGIDSNQDLSLLEIDNGPFNYVPVAKKGYRPGRNLVSEGYDSMKWPVTHTPVTILIGMSDWTYTREKPWHGRSGGGLFDVDGKCLIGVVNGYETSGQHRGIYVSQNSVIRFMARYQAGTMPTPARPPEPMRGFQYSNPFLPQLCPT